VPLILAEGPEKSVPNGTYRIDDELTSND